MFISPAPSPIVKFTPKLFTTVKLTEIISLVCVIDSKNKFGLKLFKLVLMFNSFVIAVFKSPIRPDVDVS